MSRVLISAAHKSSGKTTITAGICAALRDRDLNIQAFKKGPDYIDPMWLSRASGHACHNLDFHTMTTNEIHSVFQRYSKAKDISIIEGNKGLYDGLDVEGSNSNAALAKLLHTPVVLVIDVRGMTRGVAPLLLGYLAFDKEIEIAGVILNKLGGKRHESKLREIIAHYTDVPLLGAVHYDADLEIDERHLGLIPSNEAEQVDAKLQLLSKRIEQEVDLDRLTVIANSATRFQTSGFISPTIRQKHAVRIGIVQDSAFGFYYPGDLEALQRSGAELVRIDSLYDQSLPPVDGLFIGGGFPETHAEKLAANTSLRQQIRVSIDAGLPCYAECGGMMYLTRSLSWNGKTYDMVGALAADTIMYDRPQGRGYVKLKPSYSHPWLSSAQPPAHRHNNIINAHEFHYSGLVNIDPTLDYAYDVVRGHGITGQQDGLIYKNLLANYSHLRDVSHSRWAEQFVAFVAQHKARQPQPDCAAIL